MAVDTVCWAHFTLNLQTLSCVWCYLSHKLVWSFQGIITILFVKLTAFLIQRILSPGLPWRFLNTWFRTFSLLSFTVFEHIQNGLTVWKGYWAIIFSFFLSDSSFACTLIRLLGVHIWTWLFQLPGQIEVWTVWLHSTTVATHCIPWSWGNLYSCKLDASLLEMRRYLWLVYCCLKLSL